MSLCGLCSLLKIFHCPCIVQETSVTSSWWSVLMLMSQQLAALILLALPAFISPSSPSSSSSFKAAATAACHAHFNTPDSFDRLYGLIILNIYRSHFPKPSMFIQHLRDHSTAPFSTPPPPHPHNIHTSLFSPFFSFLSSSFPQPPWLALLQPFFSMYHCLNKKQRYFCTISSLFSPLWSSFPPVAGSRGACVTWSQAGRHKCILSI